METWREEKPQASAVKPWRIATGVLAVLLIAAVATTAVFAGKQSSQKNAAAIWQLRHVEAEETKMALHDELSTLSDEYDLQITEVGALSDALTEKVQEIEELQGRVRSAQSQLAESRANAKDIQSRLVQLEEIKAELEKDMAGLTAQNVELHRTNEKLTEILEVAQEEVSSLNMRVADLTTVNKKLTERIESIAPAGFTAGNFVITAHRRNTKLTSRAGRTNAINVTFDLRDVPEAYQREHEIYLVMTDFDGLPVASTRSSEKSVRSSDNVWYVQAANAEKVRVRGNTTVVMTVEPKDNLDPGTYNLIVYADNGYLGSTGFQLR